jgi:uncharacterized membrane protein (DUF373 family)
MESKDIQIPPLLNSILSPNFYGLMVKVLIGLLMISLGLWLVTGIFSLFKHMLVAVTGSWGHEAEKIIVDVVIILAILELVRTLQSYLELGRVKLTLILDASLVVLIGELISLWYRDYTTIEVMLSMGVITMLTLLRIVTVKFSPELCSEDDDTKSYPTKSQTLTKA